MAIENWYTEHTVRNAGQAVDEFGDSATTYGQARAVLCYIGKPSSAQAFRMAQRGVDVDGRLYAPIDANIRAYDVITDPETGRSWQVVSEPRDAGKRGHHVEADLLLLRKGVE